MFVRMFKRDFLANIVQFELMYLDPATGFMKVAKFRLIPSEGWLTTLTGRTDSKRTRSYFVLRC
jgi:hypothetical protein